MSEQQKERYRQAMIKKYGSEKAWKDFMRQAGMKGKKTGQGGFKWLQEHNPDKLKTISRKAALKRHGQNQDPEPAQTPG